jgi:hypothetical protein
MRGAAMKCASLILWFVASVPFGAHLNAQAGDSDARPPVSKADIDIVKRAAEILNSPEKWNRADNRVCAPNATTFSLYCAIERATDEISKNFQHRGAAMQEARFVIEEIAPDANHYNHRLMDFNNDPHTTFIDIRGVFWLLEKHIAMRLANPRSASPSSASSSTVTKADLQVVRRVRQLLDSPTKWNHSDGECRADAKAFSLICAFEKAEKDVTGTSDDGAAIREARAMISELDPGRSKYKARLVDYNADPTVTHTDLQTFLSQLEGRLAARLTAK